MSKKIHTHYYRQTITILDDPLNHVLWVSPEYCAVQGRVFPLYCTTHKIVVRLISATRRPIVPPHYSRQAGTYLHCSRGQDQVSSSPPYMRLMKFTEAIFSRTKMAVTGAVIGGSDAGNVWKRTGRRMLWRKVDDC